MTNTAATSVTSMNRRTPLPPILVLTAIASLSTGLFWNGLPFIVQSDYSFSEKKNYSLFILLGVIYVAVAFSAGKLLRVAERFVSPRAIIATILLSQGIGCALPGISESEWVIWLVTLYISLTSAILWPTVESYLSAGRSGGRLRYAMGLWNVTWTLAVAISLLAMGPFMTENAQIARFAIVVVGGINVFAVVTLFWFNAKPLEPGDQSASGEVGANYPYLLHAARILLPVSYVLMGMISPLLPYRMEALNIVGTLKTPLAATWMFSRVVALAIMWLMPFWHGKWGTLLLGASAMTVGLFLLLIAPNVAVLLTGLALFGGGQGVIYFAAIYYAMSVGHAQVDAAGTHEGLIGLGYAAGPAIGFVSLVVAESVFSPDDINDGLVLTRVAIIATIMLVAGALVIRPYRAARHIQSNRSSHDSRSRYMSR